MKIDTTKLPSKTRIIVLTSVFGVLALFSYRYNKAFSEKQAAKKETELTETIQFAKQLAAENQKFPQGTLVEFAHLRLGTPLDQIALGEKNGTGKNLISWGTYPADGHRPPKFGPGPAVKK